MIILDGGERLEVKPGRLTALIRWLVAHREWIERQEKMQLTFDCSGERAQAVVKERQDIDPALFT